MHVHSTLSMSKRRGERKMAVLRGMKCTENGCDSKMFAKEIRTSHSIVGVEMSPSAPS